MGGINNASVNREGINQSDVERVVRVRRRLLAAQQQLLDALVRQGCYVWPDAARCV